MQNRYPPKEESSKLPVRISLTKRSEKEKVAKGSIFRMPLAMLSSREKRVLKAFRINKRSSSGREREKKDSRKDKNAAAMTLLSKKGSKIFPGIVFDRTAR